MTNKKKLIREDTKLHEGLVIDAGSLNDWEYSPEDDNLIAHYVDEAR